VSPRYSAEVDYFGGATEVVDRLDRDALEAAVRRLTCDSAHADSLVRRGRELVEREHSMDSLERKFLCHFRGPGKEAPRA
jgi:hypothetical protein